ncbi:MAG: 4-demethylwyosine synthase TYW1 [Nanoarchaeota archaeon]|jgi:tRNA wybutosine-synthesizing protein 1|nr:4-demethylwyosine synthase TYW1 [Nanoarchaeota archaeon]
MSRARKRVRKETYEPVGAHSAVQLCNWTKKSLKGEGDCFKNKFYGIESHRCCQMTPSIFCNNRCIHCWRDITNAKDEIVKSPDSPDSIIEGAIKAQQKLLTGFKIDPNSEKIQLSKADQKKLEEAQQPNQFALSLTGEPTLYPKIGELIQKIREHGSTSFLVTNGLQPEVIQELIDNNQLPTRLYVSVNTSNKEAFDKFHRSLKENAWEKLNETLQLFKKITQNNKTVFRMNLVRDLNMEDKFIPEFASMIKNCQPDFIEIKGYMSVGFARERMGYDKMPTHQEMLTFIKKLEQALQSTVDVQQSTDYKLQDEHEASRAYVLCKDKNNLKIKKEDY